MAEWQQISRETIFTHPRIQLAEDIVQLPDGVKTPYLIIESFSDFPTIIPVLDDGRFLMTREHAYPYNNDLLQFPEGLCNPGETVSAAAIREFQEETGYTAGSLEHIGSSLHNHRRSTAKNHVFIATGLAEDETLIHRDPEEQSMKVCVVEELRIWEGIASGEIIQKNTLAAWALYQANQSV